MPKATVLRSRVRTNLTNIPWFTYWNMRIALNGKTIARPCKLKCTRKQNLKVSDEATFHTSGKANRHNLRVWGTENCFTLEHQRDSPKVNVYCAMSRSQVYGYFSPRTLSMELIT
jgi:hypothetical protein